MRRHLLVTNDFPPKTGGIQVYLFELWKRLDPQSFTVLTASSHPEAAAFDATCAKSGIEIIRVKEKTLFLPTTRARTAIEEAIRRTNSDLVLLDPAFPLGHLGSSLSVPYGVILHGAEVTIPGRIPGASHVLSRVLTDASVIVSAGSYAEAEARRITGGTLPRVINVPPGVDSVRFAPLDHGERSHVRRDFDLGGDGPLIVSVSRLVPRKGMDTLIEAAALLAPRFPSLTVAIGGNGRDRSRLEKLIAKTHAPVRLLGRISDEDLPRLLGAADLFAMACRNRFNGLLQEGFGIVFVEAAACGVPQIAGMSGGSHEAVHDGVTGLLCKDPRDPRVLAEQVSSLLCDPTRRAAMGAAARARAVASFDYSVLAPRLGAGLEE